jgi:hypothetical protein
MQRYAVMIEVDNELMYVSADNPFDYKSEPKLFDTKEEAELAATNWLTGRVVPYHSWDNWHEGEVK